MQVDLKLMSVLIACSNYIWTSLTWDHDVVTIPDGEQMRPVLQRGRDVFGIVEKAEVKPVHSPRRVSIGSSGEDGIQRIFV